MDVGVLRPWRSFAGIGENNLELILSSVLNMPFKSFLLEFGVLGFRVHGHNPVIGKRQ